jgi:hypothetical protein
MVNTALNTTGPVVKEVTKAKNTYVKLICTNTKEGQCPFGISCELADASENCSLCGSKLEKVAEMEMEL